MLKLTRTLEAHAERVEKGEFDARGIDVPPASLESNVSADRNEDQLHRSEDGIVRQPTASLQAPNERVETPRFVCAPATPHFRNSSSNSGTTSSALARWRLPDGCVLRGFTRWRAQ